MIVSTITTIQEQLLRNTGIFVRLKFLFTSLWFSYQVGGDFYFLASTVHIQFISSFTNRILFYNLIFYYVKGPKGINVQD